MISFCGAGVFCYIIVLSLVLAFTIMIECLTAYLIGFRKKKNYTVIVCTDCITNPLVNIVFILFRLMLNNSGFFGFVFLSLEVIVVFAERYLFSQYMDFREETHVFGNFEFDQRALFTSIILNASSAALGHFLFLLIV